MPLPVPCFPTRGLSPRRNSAGGLFSESASYVEEDKDWGKKLPSEFSLVSCSNPNIIIETFKQSEDGKGYIIRLYDAHNCNTNAVLSFGVDLKRVFLCDLLENPGSELHLEGRKVKVPVSNFEIVTLKVEK